MARRDNLYEESPEEVLDHAPCGFISTKPDGMILRVNQTFLDWTGHDAHDLLSGRRFQDLLTVPGRIFYETHFAPLLRMQGFVKEIACHIARKDRPPLPVLVNSKLKLDASGQPLVVRTTVFDATDRTKYEEELRRARRQAEQLAAIVTSSTDAIVSIDESGTILSWNAAAETMFGWTAAEAIGRRKDELIVPADQTSAFRDTLERVGGGAAERFDSVRQRRDGTLIDVSANVSLIRNADGAPTGISVIHRDITERKRAEEALRQHTEALRLTFDTATTGLVRNSRDLRYLVVNGAYAHLVGRPVEQITGRTLQEVLGAKGFETVRPYIDRVLAGERVEYEVELPLAAGPRTIHVVYTPDRDSAGQVIGFFGSIVDITERMRAQEQIRLLMGEVNHRAKNLLGVVQAVARQTARNGDPATFGERFGERLQGLAASQDLLVRNAWHGIDLSELVRSQIAHFKDLIGTRIQIEGEPVACNAKAAQGIGMALHELATNAGKYGALSDARGVVRVSWRIAGAEPDAQLHLEWREAHGPVVEKPAHRGFGQMVIVTMAGAAVGGRASIDYATSGVVWQLTAPLTGVVEDVR